ncbi:MAG: hypothetical protein JXA09_02575 [Anaerolineae bacterium]|nr:hypothetical protein [Anaerolineae bacterium]
MRGAKTAGTIALLVTGLVFLCVGGVLGGFGVLYILAAHAQDAADPGSRLSLGIGMVVVGLVIWLFAALGAFLAWRRMQPKPEQKVTIHQQVELTGDIDLASLSCQKCNAKLDKDAIVVQGGAIVVSCPYCGSTYQIVEEPKW